MEFVDTHCHIHFADYGLPVEEVIADAQTDGVTRLICVGTTIEDSRLAIEFAQNRPGVSASIGLHPHDAKLGKQTYEQLTELAGQPKVVAIGECGLDYYYSYSPKEAQIEALHFQLNLAREHNLPCIFHVRDAFEDFWPIYDQYKVRSVIHSFTAGITEVQQIISRDLYIGLNGIMTFTKNADQLAAAKAIPLEKLLLETDAPFLTPVPFRGKMCQPKYVRVTAEFLSGLREEQLEQLAEVTTANAQQLFGAL